MPKFIGNKIAGAVQIEKNAKSISGQRVNITYAQAVKLPPHAVIFSLDTTDRGGPKSLAKRRYRWFATPDAILMSPYSTDSMRGRAMRLQYPK